MVSSRIPRDAEWAGRAVEEAERLEKAGRTQEAEAQAREVAAAVPQHAPAHALLGSLAARRGDAPAAIEHLRRAVALAPEAGQWQLSLCRLARGEDRLEEAVAAGREAMRLLPQSAEAMVDLGMSLMEGGDFDGAAGCYLQGIARDPECAPAHVNLSHLVLVSGQMRAGWAEYEWRLKLPEFRRTLPEIRCAPWNGMRLPGARILLIGDQGYGDTLQFARYIPMVAERCGEVVLGVSAPLAPVLSRAPGVARSFTRWEEVPPVAAYAVLSSLPYIFGTELGAIPSGAGTIRPDPAKVQHWDQRLAQRIPRGRPRIGLAWSGRPTHPGDRHRSIRLGHLAPLIDQPNLSFVALQPEISPTDMGDLAIFPNVADFSTSLVDFGETAALIQNLDLVITVDTAVAHLSGTLGKPTWVLVPFVPDWRWLLGREDTPWYPSMRLFRQGTRGAWAPVVERLRRELAGERTAPMPLPQPAAPPAADPALVQRTLAQAEAQRQAGRLAEAETLCREVLRLDPGNAEAFHRLGIIAHEAGNAAAAIDFVRRAVALDGGVALYHSNLCELLRLARRFEDAVKAGERAVTLDPRSQQAQMNLGVAYYDVEDYVRAAESHERSIALGPKFATPWSNLGNALRAQHKLEQALSAYERAIQLQPDYADAIANCASALHLIGRLEDAAAYHRRAIALDPMQANAHSGLALMLLLDGRFEEGWHEYEWRWRSTEVPPNPRPQGPQWEGERPNGRRILVYAEQGYGDVLHFCRYVPLLIERGAKVTLAVQPGVRELIAHSMPEAEVRDGVGGGAPAWDRQCPLLSLPRLFRTDLDSIPAKVPYLFAPPEAARRWQERIGADGLRIGIAWAGNPKHVNDVARSIALGALAPLLAVPGTRFFSLQVGPHATDAATAPAVADLSPHLVSFTETAGATANLDLVITVDTSVAHLAGALGKPVWVLVSYVPDWRWLKERETSPWYPTMRLFRQPQRLTWGPVVERLTAELQAVAKGDRGRLLP